MPSASSAQPPRERYFESLIRLHLLDNPHSAFVMLVPRPGLTQHIDEKLQKALQAVCAAWRACCCSVSGCD